MTQPRLLEEGDRPGSGTDPLVTKPPLPGEPHPTRARADLPTEELRDCTACGSTGAVRASRCEVCDAPEDGAVDLPPAASSPPGHTFLRLSDVLVELRGVVASVAAAHAGEDLTYVVDRLERLLIALRKQFVAELMGES